MLQHLLLFISQLIENEHVKIHWRTNESSGFWPFFNFQGNWCWYIYTIFL